MVGLKRAGKGLSKGLATLVGASALVGAVGASLPWFTSINFVLLAIAALAAGGLPFSLGRAGSLVRLSRILIYYSLLEYGWGPFVLLTAGEALLCQTCAGFGSQSASSWAKPAANSLFSVLRWPLSAGLASLAFTATTSLAGDAGPSWPWAVAALAAAWVGTVSAAAIDLVDLPATRSRISELSLQGLLESAAALGAVAAHAWLREAVVPGFGLVLVLVAVILRMRESHHLKERELARQSEEYHDLYHATLQTMALAVDARDQIDHGHLFRVQAISLQLARRAGVRNDNDLRGLAIASLLHDIGKLATPEYILSKSGSLTPMEKDAVEAHAEVGADILSLVPFPYPVLPFVRHHHERWDGQGYPAKLRGEEIPLGARILSIADCYDSMRTPRPYRPGWSRHETLDHIRSESGESFDPQLVELFLKGVDDFDESAEAACRDSLPGYSPPLGEPNQDRQANVLRSIVSAHQEMQAMQEVSGAAGHLMSVPEALSFLAGKIQSLVRGASCAIFLGMSGGPLECRFANGLLCEELERLRLESGHGVTGWVAENGRSAVNVSPALDFQGLDADLTTFQSCLSVPLISEPGISAVITLYSQVDNGFPPRDVRVVKKLAQFAGPAVRNAVLFEDTKKHAYSDSLTGLPNLRYFKTFAEQELRRADRLGYPVSFVMMDLDRFKEINDQFGHSSGDQVLIHMARLLRHEMRRSDTCIRYGGDEFIGIMPGASKASAQVIVDKIQAASGDQPIELSRGDFVRIGVSIGVATFPEDSRNLDHLLNLADQRMYRDKLSRTSIHLEGSSATALQT